MGDLNQHSRDFEKERLRLVIEGTRLGMWDWNPQTDEVTFNALWAQMLGHTLDEIPFTLEAWSSRVHPDDLEGCYADIKRHMGGETAFYENIHRMKHKDGSWRHILDRGRIVERDAEGNPTRFTGTHTDLTPQIEAELTAKEALKAKDRFLAKVSHEIRTPLHGVLGLVGLLEEHGLTSEQRELTGHVRSCGETLLVLINDLLDVTKAAEGRLELDPHRIGVREVVGEVCALFQTLAADKDVVLNWQVHDDVPEAIVADGHRLKQVITNLLSNAVKFTSEGGVRVHVGTRLHPDGQRLVLRVEDDGIGIENTDQVWEAFGQDSASTAREHGGTGLGLTLVRQLVELLGGEISMTSELGAGTTFELWVPVSVADDERPAAKAAAKTDFSALSVLVADDNPVNRVIASGLLKRWGAAVTTADNGAEAVAACREAHFDVAILDLTMPVMDGMEAVEQIRRRYPSSSLPVVAVTADAYPDTRRRCLEAGFDAFLTKPFNAAKLRALLREVTSGEQPATEPKPAAASGAEAVAG